METRFTGTTALVKSPCRLARNSGANPTGNDKVLTEEVLVEGAGFVTCIRTTTYQEIGSSRRHAGLTEHRPILEGDHVLSQIGTEEP